MKYSLIKQNRSQKKHETNMPKYSNYEHIWLTINNSEELYYLNNLFPL